ncbi:MAG: type 4a pilus biogenesis protein PilO [Thermoanaerobaculia bacterium]
MTPWRRVWVEEWRRWGPPLAALVLALILWAVYHLHFAGRVGRLANEVAGLEAELERTMVKREELAQMQQWRREGDEQARALLEDRLGPRSRRLTEVLRHVKDLAGRAGIQPDSVRYTTEPTPDEDLERVSWSYSVVGNYGQVRRFLHLLETTDVFFILEDVRLAEVEEQSAQLRIQLGLSTVFTLPGATGGESL